MASACVPGCPVRVPRLRRQLPVSRSGRAGNVPEHTHGAGCNAGCNALRVSTVAVNSYRRAAVLCPAPDIHVGRAALWPTVTGGDTRPDVAAAADTTRGLTRDSDS